MRQQLRTSESGQTVVLGALFLTVILGFTALLVDSGSWLLQKRNLQGVADAAALAGVRELPLNPAGAVFVADDYISRNSADGATRDLSVEAVPFVNTIQIEVERDGGGSFIALFDVAEPRIVARATAVVSQVRAMPGMMPFGMMAGSFVFGESKEVKTQQPEIGNTGMIAPPMGDSPACPDASGVNDTEALLSGAVDACPVEPDIDPIPVQPGVAPNKIEQALDARIGASGSSGDSFTDVFEEINGSYSVKKPDSGRFGIIPVITNADGSTTWPSGNQGGGDNIIVKYYVFCYVGKKEGGDTNGYDSNPKIGGKSVYVVPLSRVSMPTNMPGVTYRDTWDASSNDPVAYRLTE